MFGKLFMRTKTNRKKNNHTIYNESLIPSLKDAHGSLFKLYMELESAYKEDDEKWHNIVDHLKNFENALKLHVMLEDQQLYTYLEHLYEETQNSDYLEQLHELQKNMGDILKEVNHFKRKYSDWENYKRVKEDFLTDLNTIGKVLTQRVELEENFVYPMYLQTEQ